MKSIEHWSGEGSIEVAENVGGVLATVDPFANLIRGGVSPWPPPELLQKLHASERWRGKTLEDDRRVREYLGYYCDLQSLNSEDALTWSVFGPLIHGPAPRRLEFVRSLFTELGLPCPIER